MKVGRNLLTGSESRGTMRDAIANISRKASVRIMGGPNAPPVAKCSGKKHVMAVKKLKFDRRLTPKILERYGRKNVGQESETHASTLEWAKRVLSGGNKNRVGSSDSQSLLKRQRPQEGEACLDKKPQAGAASTFSEISELAGCGVLDRSREDIAISRYEWEQVAAAPDGKVSDATMAFTR